MAFVVKFNEKDDGTEFGKEDSYQFLHDGVLKVSKKDQNMTTYYGPGAWYSVHTADDHQPTPTPRLPAALSRFPGLSR
jgi:hypothetical protein